MRPWRFPPACAALAGIVALAAILAGCGKPGTGTPLAPPPAADTELMAQDEDAAAGPVRAYFNDTYGESVAANEPQARSNPYNTDKSLFKLIRGARRSLDVSFYDLEEPAVAEALVAAKRRGVRVRVVTDTDNVKGEDGSVRDSLRLIKSEGLGFREDKRSAIMHDKFVVADHRVVWTGSTNATVRSLYWHNNNAIVVRSEALAAIYTRVFERYFVDGSFGPSDVLFGLQDGAGIPVAGAQVQPFFSPKGGGKAAVVSELMAAGRAIRFMTFSLTDKEVGDVLVAKSRQGLEVEGVLDRWLAAGQYSLFDSLKRRGVRVIKDGNQALMHHKVIVIDDDVVITGSFNYSQNAEMSNNENFLIVRSPMIARAYLKEFGRIERAARNNHPPPYKPKDPEAGTGHQ